MAGASPVTSKNLLRISFCLASSRERMWTAFTPRVSRWLTIVEPKEPVPPAIVTVAPFIVSEPLLAPPGGGRLLQQCLDSGDALLDRKGAFVVVAALGAESMQPVASHGSRGRDGIGDCLHVVGAHGEPGAGLALDPRRVALRGDQQLPLLVAVPSDGHPEPGSSASRSAFSLVTCSHRKRRGSSGGWPQAFED